jgi:hypothetical protein
MDQEIRLAILAFAGREVRKANLLPRLQLAV